MIRSVYGWSTAAKIAMDQETILRSHRLGGLPSSNLLFHSYNGSLTDMDVSDLYGLPENNPNVQPAARSAFEKQFLGEEIIFQKMKL